MSLINDALRRANQSDKDRPRPAATAVGMEPAPVSRGSGVSIVLAVLVVLALLAAGWFFRQWWILRNSVQNQPAPVQAAAPSSPNVFPAVNLQVSSHPVVTPKPAPVPAAPVKSAPVAPVASASPATAPQNAPAAKPIVWPDLKLNAVFYNRSNPRALINGSIFATGDVLYDVVIKKIDQDGVTVEFHGHTKVLTMSGQ